MEKDTGITSAMTGGIIYFRLTEPRYGGDTTKGCGLTGGEIDKNFNFLRGYDIEKGSWDNKTKVLVLERINGEKIIIGLPIDGSGTTQVISFEGSTFSSESGGTLSLVANGSEPYLITGFTESCTELIEALNVLSEKIDTIGNEITILTEEYDENFLQIFEFINVTAEEKFNELRQALDTQICEVNQRILQESEIRSESISNLEENVNQELSDFNTRLSGLNRTCTVIFQNLENRINRLFEITSEQSERIETLNEKVDEGFCDLNAKIVTEKNERNEKDEELSNTIQQKETELRRLISQETRTRQSADSILHSLIASEVDERRNNIRRLEALLNSEEATRIGEDNNIRLAISMQRNQIESLIEAETRARRYQDSLLHNEIAGRISTVGQNIEALKAYAKWLYFASAEDILTPCDKRKWGISIRDITEGENAGRREIFLNLNPNDKFLSQDCNYLASYIELRYNEEYNRIELIGKDGIVASYIDANIFLQKGFLISADVETIGDRIFLVLNWENGDKTRIPVDEMFKPYAKGNGISIDDSNRVISVSIGDEEQYLTFRNGKLVTRGIEDKINSIVSSLRTDIEALISQEVIIINEEISGISHALDEIEQSMVYLDDFYDYTARTETVLNEFSANFLEIIRLINELRQEIDADGLLTRIERLEETVSGISLTLTGMSEQILVNREDIETLYGAVEKNGTVTQPSLNVSLTTNKGTGTFEVGTLLTITGSNYTFNSGHYQYGPNPTGVEQVGSARTGYTQTVSNNQFRVEDNANLQYQVSVDYSEGLIPLTNLGRPGTNRIHAGTITQRSNAITSYRNSFFASMDYTLSENEFNSTIIKGAAGESGKDSSDTFNILISAEDKEVFIAIPHNKRLVSILDVNFNNTDIKENFSEKVQQILIGGAGEYSPIYYRVFYYTPDVPFTVNNTYIIKIENNG